MPDFGTLPDPLTLPEQYTYLIFKSGSSYYAKTGLTQDIYSSNSAFHTLLNAIITACSDGDSVAIMPGTYTQTGAIVILKNNFTLAGVGYVEFDINSEIDGIELGDGGATTYSNILVRGITIDQNNVDPATGPFLGIYGRKVNDVKVYNCEIKNQTAHASLTAGGMYFTDCIGGEIVGNHVHNVINGILPGTGSKGFRISNNKVHDVLNYDGIAPYQKLGYHIIENNECYSCAFAGINIDGGSTSTTRNDNTIVSGNNCHDNTLYGIQAYSSYYPVITGNVCRANGNYGIYLNQLGDLTFNCSANECLLNTNHGIYATESRYGTISANNCGFNTNHGIFLISNSHNNTISGNHINHNQQNGLRLDHSSETIVTGNLFAENGQATDNTWADVILRNTTIRCEVNSNKFIASLTNRTKYGIEENSATDTDNRYQWNRFSIRHATAPIIISSTSSKAKGNVNYTTENSGKSTQNGDASAKAFNIAHGCNATPTSVLVLPGHADALGPYALTVTSSNIVVTYPTAPPTGTGNVILWWKAEVFG